jgi:hypothetical protein
LSVKLTPLGSGPVFPSVGVGNPVAVTGNEPAVPTTNVTLLPLVIAGGCPEVCETPAEALAAKFPSVA